MATKVKKELLSEKAKRYLISAGLSFLAAFAIVFLTQIESITLDSFKDGAFVGVIFMCVRAGVKAVFEYIVSVLK